MTIWRLNDNNAIDEQDWYFDADNDGYGTAVAFRCVYPQWLR